MKKQKQMPFCQLQHSLSREEKLVVEYIANTRKNAGRSEKKAEEGRKMNEVESKPRCKSCNGALQLERA
jgi:hypothetical protein